MKNSEIDKLADIWLIDRKTDRVIDSLTGHLNWSFDWLMAHRGLADSLIDTPPSPLHRAAVPGSGEWRPGHSEVPVQQLRQLPGQHEWGWPQREPLRSEGRRHWHVPLRGGGHIPPALHEESRQRHPGVCPRWEVSPICQNTLLEHSLSILP